MGALVQIEYNIEYDYNSFTSLDSPRIVAIMGNRFYKSIECTHASPPLTSGAGVYPHVEALYGSTDIKYVTVEEPCCGTLRVAVEQHCLKIRKSRATPSSVVWTTTIIPDLSSIGKVPPSFRVSRVTAARSGSCAEQSCTASSNIRNVHNAVVSVDHTIQEYSNT